MACDERVGRGTITWPCSLDPNHPGPHYAIESSASAGDRRRWEAEQGEKIRHASSGLAEFQGVAQTTAQRYTENATRVPVSSGRARLHQECSPVACLVYDGDAGNRISAWSECPYEPGPPPRVISNGAAGLPPGTYTATLDAGLPTEEPVIVRSGLDEIDPRIMAGEKITAHGEFEIRPTKTREGDQVLPTGDESIPDDQSLVIADIEQRRQIGIERYGQGHRPFNGRNTILDGYEEVLDLLVYWRSLLRAREATRDDLIEIVAADMLPSFATLFQGDTGNQVARELATKAVDRILDSVLLKAHGDASGES